MDIINLPYCFLFIPLIFSGLNILQNYKVTNVVITVLVCAFILLLGFYLIPDLLPNKIFEHKINNNVLFITGEYRITLKNLIFIILIFFSKLISFVFFDDKAVNVKKLNFFFAIYLINFFSICGILLTDNIFNMFIYIEIYSFTIYNLMSDYRHIGDSQVAYNYYNSGVVGSILLLFFTFVVYFTFGNSDINYISHQLSIVKNNYFYNFSIIIFFFALFLKFFSFNFYFSRILKSSKITNILFINIFFSDLLLGIYILWKILYSIFDLNFLLNDLGFNFLFYGFGSSLILYNSYNVIMRKNLLPLVYSFSLISLGYVLILLGLNNSFTFSAINAFLINHIFINFLFYLIVALCLFLFEKTDAPILYFFYKYKYIIFSILLSKLAFPIAFGFDCYWNFVLSVVDSHSYYLLIPLVIEKMAISVLFVRFYFVFCREPKEDYVYLDLDDKISLNTNYMVIILMMFCLMILVSFFQGSISNALFDYVLNGGV